ncbi:hypothetical protein R9X47_25705 [Wukongibacter baidiensis]|uniref:phosphotriesterase family protein n=1 Tax=Wukongibacter baidiensis TaxID=1723361 RepID=UPI003D7F620C
MIQTVKGIIDANEIGVTLMHEHIICDSIGADYIDNTKYDVEEIVKTMILYLKKLKEAGCDTLVDSTPPGEGRSAKILKECSIQSGLNIITNTGSFYGNGVSKDIRENDIEEIVQIWEKEYIEGIDGTKIKPGFIKIALDDGRISLLQEKILRAACRTSLKTNLSIQCHAILSETVSQATSILKEEGVEFSKFIWAHADSECNIPKMVELGKQEMWIEIDSIGSMAYEKHIDILKVLIEKGIIDRLLISQDTGWYNIGEEKGGNIRPYHKILTEFIPICYKKGLKKEEIHTIMVSNPARCLDIKLG